MMQQCLVRAMRRSARALRHSSQHLPHHLLLASSSSINWQQQRQQGVQQIWTRQAACLLALRLVWQHHWQQQQQLQWVELQAQQRTLEAAPVLQHGSYQAAAAVQSAAVNRDLL
jgi:hypothetical protein